MTDDTDGETGGETGVRAGERIAKRLARAGVASRREAERMIEAGRVSVNGARIDSPALNVVEGDRITVDGAEIGAPERARLWRYHKPTGLVTSASDEKGRATVFDRLPPELPRVVSVGRLDLNSEGLLLLTNDGELKRRLELPSTGWTRRYRVRAHGRIDDKGLEPLRKGMRIEGERFMPMTVAIEREQGANLWLSIGLKEGKNREVRRALEAVGLTVNRLIRVSYGPFQLGDLTPGAVEEVRAKTLRDQLGARLAPPEPEGAAKDDDAKAGRPAADGSGPRKPGRAKAGAPGSGGAKAGPGKPIPGKPGRGKPGASPSNPGRSGAGRPGTRPQGRRGPKRG